ncbi:MAG: hypothetical protein QOI07_3239 [Verrucomicrobiota bacterium]|jgi:hypothetical protein
MPTKQSITTAPTQKQNEETCSCRLRGALNKVLALHSDDPKDAAKFAEALKTLAENICSLHLRQKALFLSLEGHPDPWDNFLESEFDAAKDAMRALRKEIDSAIARQRTLVATLELRATLLRVKVESLGVK